MAASPLASHPAMGSVASRPFQGWAPPRPRGLVVISAGSGHLSAAFCWQTTFDMLPHCLLTRSSALLGLRGCSRRRVCWNVAGQGAGVGRRLTAVTPQVGRF